MRLRRPFSTDKTHLLVEIRNAFAAGLIVVLPVIVTVWVIVFLFKMVDGVLGGIIYPIIGKRIWGLGFVVTVATLIGIGFLTKNIVGHSILRYFENLFARVPLVKNIYTSSKQIVNAITLSSSASSFKKVVLVEYPRRGMFTVGFLTRDEPTLLSSSNRVITEGLISVFLPTSPNPTSGYFVMLPREDVRILDMNVEDGVKLIMSAGIVVPGSAEALPAGEGTPPSAVAPEDGTAAVSRGEPPAAS